MIYFFPLLWHMEDSVIPVWLFSFKCWQCFLFPFVALELGSQLQTEPLSVHINH